MAAPTIVFDLDGTLVDTAPDLVGTLNVIFTREGLAPIPYDDARPMIGAGARTMLERGLLKEGRILPHAEVDRLVADFIAHYAEHIADKSLVFPGLETALDTLSAQGCRLAVCTNKLEWLSVRLLDRLDLTRRFAAICGADTFNIPKPNPEILRRTIHRAGGDPAAAIMVGDSATDVDTARAAGIPVIAVDFGYSEIPVAHTNPDRVIGHYNQLTDAITALNLQAERL